MDIAAMTADMEAAYEKYEVKKAEIAALVEQRKIFWIRYWQAGRKKTVRKVWWRRLVMNRVRQKMARGARLAAKGEYMALGEMLVYKWTSPGSSLASPTSCASWSEICIGLFSITGFLSLFCPCCTFKFSPAIASTMLIILNSYFVLYLTRYHNKFPCLIGVSKRGP